MILQVKVKPNAKKSALEKQPDGTWIAFIKAPPVDGKANAELIRLVADELDVPKSSVSIRTGAGSKLKLVEVDQD